ncbi:MAG: hypothetical protein OEM25_07455 [Gammaproteobacteria bacterium]|nr:hypothetical protein [Gammaproteobacteria bacterium]
MNTKTVVNCGMLVAALLVVGCSRQPTVPAAEFGATVRNVMESQIHDYEAAMHPDPNAVEGGDPYRLEAAVNAHRADVSQPADVKQPVTVNVGN